MQERGGEKQIGGLHEVYFGIFKESEHDYSPRKKAIVLQELAGGTADLYTAGRKSSEIIKF